MRIAPHHHPCGHCGAKTECCADLAHNYDGHPEWICRAYDAAHRLPLDFLCEGCEALSVCEDCGAWGDEPHDRRCAEASAVPTRRRYTFSVYLEAPEPVNADDGDGYTRADVEALIKRLLASFAPFKGHPRVVADWELMDDEPVTT